MHMTGRLELLENQENITPFPIQLPNGRVFHAKIMGRVRMNSSLILYNVLYIQGFACNLISVGRLTIEMNCLSMAVGNYCILQDLTMKKPIGVGELRGGVYQLRHVAPSTMALVTRSQSYDLWHQRLGHPSRTTLHLVPALSLSHDDFCPSDICLRAKQTRVPFSTSEGSAAACFDLVHCDIWGPYQTPSLSGAHYFLTLVDDKSRGV